MDFAHQAADINAKAGYAAVEWSEMHQFAPDCTKCIPCEWYKFGTFQRCIMSAFVLVKLPEVI